MQEHDLVVIGAGPGGYVAAIRAAQLGMNVACVEKEPALGGTCLRVGCIPSKALLESSERFAAAETELAEHGVQAGEVSLDLSKMLRRKTRIVNGLTKGVEVLFKKRRIVRYEGHARIEGTGRVVVGGENGNDELKAKHIILATGSRPASLPGVEPDGNRIGTSTDALAYEDVPEHLVVIGAGYIGLELGTVWRRLGSRVTILEYLDRILPGSDAEIAREAQKTFKKQGIEFRLGSRVTGARVENGDCLVECEDAEPIHCDRVLVAVGRVPNTDGLGLDLLDIELDDAGHIAVNESFETSAAGVYAIGDVIHGPMLAHKAQDEGVACVERIATGFGHVNYDAIPSVVYTQPEIAAVGRTEEELQDEGVAFHKGVFPFQANGRARVLGHTAGRVKILADSETDRLLGIHILGPRAGDLIAEAAAAIEFGASSEDLGRLCHAHPTLAEALKEAALAARDRTIHS